MTVGATQDGDRDDADTSLVEVNDDHITRIQVADVPSRLRDREAEGRLPSRRRCLNGQNPVLRIHGLHDVVARQPVEQASRVEGEGEQGRQSEEDWKHGVRRSKRD